MKRNQSGKKKYSQQIGDSKKSIGLFFFLSAFFLIPLSFALEPLDDSALAEVTGYDGISLMLNNVSLSGTHSITYNPSGTESLQINNLVIDNATASTAATGGANAGSTANPFTLDIDSIAGLVFAMPAAASGTMNNLHLGIDQLLINNFLIGGVDIYGLNLEGTSFGIKSTRTLVRSAVTESVLIQCSNFNNSGNCSGSGANPLYMDFVRRPALYNSSILIAAAIKANIAQLKVTPPAGSGAMEINGLTIDNGAGAAWNLGTIMLDFGSGYQVDAGNFNSQFDTNGNLTARLGPAMFVQINGGGTGNIRINNVTWHETSSFSNQQSPGTPVNMGAVQIDGFRLIKLNMTL